MSFYSNYTLIFVIHNKSDKCVLEMLFTYILNIIKTLRSYDLLFSGLQVNLHLLPYSKERKKVEIFIEN